jgi:hypothetical protein
MPAPPATALAQPEPDSPAAAIAHCRAAYLKAHDAYVRTHGGPGKLLNCFFGREHGGKAYCKVMPELSSRENIRAFIACVADGVLIEAILAKNSGRLLYAAQVALAALPRESAQPKTANPRIDRKPGRPRKASQLPASKSTQEASI